MEQGSNRMETDQDSNVTIQVVYTERNSVQMNPYEAELDNFIPLPLLAAKCPITEDMEKAQ